MQQNNKTLKKANETLSFAQDKIMVLPVVFEILEMFREHREQYIFYHS